MTKQEAIAAMKQGIKITHRGYSSDEWSTMKEGYVLFEDGCRCTPHEF